jgi:hypothetical protein
MEGQEDYCAVKGPDLHDPSSFRSVVRMQRRKFRLNLRPTSSIQEVL